jgi:hypothetical protein
MSLACSVMGRPLFTVTLLAVSGRSQKLWSCLLTTVFTVIFVMSVLPPLEKVAKFGRELNRDASTLLNVQCKEHVVHCPADYESAIINSASDSDSDLARHFQLSQFQTSTRVITDGCNVTVITRSHSHMTSNLSLYLKPIQPNIKP